MMTHNVYNRDTKLKQKLIVFDSPDGTGKTNISQALARHLNIPYFRMDSQHDNWRKKRFQEALEFDQTYIASFLRQTTCDVVIDRAYPSEWVYSKVFKRKTNEEVLEQVDREFARLGAHIVVPLRRDYTNNRKDEVVPQEKLQELHDTYLKFCEWSKCTTIKIYVDDFGDDLEKELKALLPEFEFERDTRLMFVKDVTLGRPVAQKDVSDLYKMVEATHSVKVDFKKNPFK